jgi:hypothetical protein
MPLARNVTVGPPCTSLVNAAFACSLGVGIAPLSIGLMR